MSIEIQHWNPDFSKRVEDGDAGKQSQLGLFYENEKGNIVRLVEAEGHEIAYNPEVATRNLIGNEAESEEVRSYRVTFGKDIIIMKGAPNYEFFATWRRGRYTGNNAKLRVYLVDFRIDEPDAPHFKYYTESMNVTCTVESANETDGLLTVNFSQDGDHTVGVMRRTDSSTSDDISTFTYGFISSNMIEVTGISISDNIGATLELGINETAKAVINFAPLGSNQNFKVDSSAPTVARVSRERQSVIITGVSVGTADIIITSVADPTIKAEIEVTVS